MLTKKQERLMKKDFKNFCYAIWKELGLPEPTPLQYDIADFLQDNSRRRLQISAFRGCGKSYLTAAFVVWSLWKDKELKIMVVSAGSSRADAFAIFVRNLIKNISWLKHLEPDKSLGERATQNVFDIHGATPSGSPSVKSVGIGGQMTGSRADIIIADDIEVVANSATMELREKLLRLCTEFDAILTPNGRTIYLGTPQCEMSVYNTLYHRGYDMRIWCALVPNETQAESYGAKLAPFIRDMMRTKEVGTSTDPKRFSDEDLAERRLSYGASGFALQFQLDTSLSDADKYPLNISDLIISSLNDKLPDEVFWTNNPIMALRDVPNVAMEGQKFYMPEKLSDSFSSPQMTILSIDPSGRGKDETAYTVLQLLNGNMFVRKFGGMLGGYTDETLGGLAEIAKKYKVNKVLIESNFGR